MSDKKTMYRAGVFTAEIKPIEIVNATIHTVTYYNSDGRVETERKATDNHFFSDKEEDARQWLIMRYQKEIERAKRIIESNESKIKKITM